VGAMMENKKYHIIFHIDMNCFFASCEIAENQLLKGKPVVVAHNDVFKKGIVLTASYEARAYGVYTTMKLLDVFKICPQVVIVEPHMSLYKSYSKKFFDYFYNITPLVQKMSIDEGFLDVTEVCNNNNPLLLAQNVQKDLLAMGLPCSIGVAPNKFLAKMASDMKKPLGITVLRKREISEILWPMKINEMFGVGKKTAIKLGELNIKTIGDLANFKDMELLNSKLGTKWATGLYKNANGEGSVSVEVEDSNDFASTSNSKTLMYDENRVYVLKDILRNLCNSMCFRMERAGKGTKRIGLQIKYSNYDIGTYSMSLNAPINDNIHFYQYTENLFDENYDGVTNVRMVRIYTGKLESIKEKADYNLFSNFTEIEKKDNIKKLLENINKQYGNNTIKVGIKEDKKNENRRN